MKTEVEILFTKVPKEFLRKLQAFSYFVPTANFPAQQALFSIQKPQAPAFLVLPLFQYINPWYVIC